MDERVHFVARLLDAEKMAPLGREFVISRKIGYRSLTATKKAMQTMPRARIR